MCRCIPNCITERYVNGFAEKHEIAGLRPRSGLSASLRCQKQVSILSLVIHSVNVASHKRTREVLRATACPASTTTTRVVEERDAAVTRSTSRVIMCEAVLTDWSTRPIMAPSF